MCLLLKLLQLQPDDDIIDEFVLQKDFKYLRALAIFYIRLTAGSTVVYKKLEPLYADYRKLSVRTQRGWDTTTIDGFVDELLFSSDNISCDLTMPFLPKRAHLTATRKLKGDRISSLTGTERLREVLLELESDALEKKNLLMLQNEQKKQNEEEEKEEGGEDGGLKTLKTTAATKTAAEEEEVVEEVEMNLEPARKKTKKASSDSDLGPDMSLPPSIAAAMEVSGGVDVELPPSIAAAIGGKGGNSTFNTNFVNNAIDNDNDDNDGDDGDDGDNDYLYPQSRSSIDVMDTIDGADDDGGRGMKEEKREKKVKKEKKSMFDKMFSKKGKRSNGDKDSNSNMKEKKDGSSEEPLEKALASKASKLAAKEGSVEYWNQLREGLGIKKLKE